MNIVKNKYSKLSDSHTIKLLRSIRKFCLGINYFLFNLILNKILIMYMYMIKFFEESKKLPLIKNLFTGLDKFG